MACFDRETSGCPAGVLAVPVDVRDDTAVRRAVSEVTEQLGGIDVLVNNAGVGAQGTVEDNDDDEWHRVIDVNLMGVVRITDRTATRAWYGKTPSDFLFAVKGGRFITHVKRLSGVEAALANFFASGLLALEDKLGPVLWQLPARATFDRPRLAGFLAQLPPTSGQAARLAQGHDAAVEGRALTSTTQDRPMRHALEARHTSFADPAALDLLRQYGVALVLSDSAGTWPVLDHDTADFAYVRLHGDAELYTSGYGEQALRRWAARVAAWRDGGRDAYVYLDNDVKVHAPFDALALEQVVAAT